MRFRSHGAWPLALFAALALVPSAAAQDDAARWLRNCERDHDDYGNHNTYCEVRNAGFRPSGQSLTVYPDQNGGAELVGWDRDSVDVSIRIQGHGKTDSDAKDIVRQISVEASGSNIRVSGPSSGHRQGWGVILYVRVPKKLDIKAETVNGPLSVEGVTGTMDLRAKNGPVSLSQVGGDVRAYVQNGPLTVELSGTSWNGKGLDAEAVNGPLDLALPDNYNAELETGTVNGPYDIGVPLTVTLKGRTQDRIHSTLGKGGAPVRAVTTNGPLTIRRAS